MCRLLTVVYYSAFSNFAWILANWKALGEGAGSCNAEIEHVHQRRLSQGAEQSSPSSLLSHPWAPAPAPLAKGGTETIALGFPCLFKLQRGPVCVKSRHLLNFLQTAIALHGTHLKATGPEGPGLEEELVLVKELKLQYLILLVAEMAEMVGERKGSPKTVHINKQARRWK